MDSGPPTRPAESDRSAAATTDRLGSLLEAADIASFRLSPDGTLEAVNDAFTSVTGYTRDELLGTSFSRLTDDESPTPTSIVASAETTPVTRTLSLRTKAGTELTCDVHLERVDAGDGTTAIDGLVDRRPAASATVDAAGLTYGKTFQALADALPDGIIVLDTDSDVQYANPAVERILGYTPDELVGSSKVRIIPPRLQQAHLDSLQRYLETGERNLNWTYVELPGQHKAGHEVPLGVSLNDFTYEGDRYFVGLFRDISPRKEAERTLRAKVEQLESVATLGRHALENEGIDDLFDGTVDLVASSLDADHCAVLEDRDGEPGLVPRAGTGDAFDVAGDALEALESVAAEALAASEPMVVEDVTGADWFDESSGSAAVRSVAVVPIGATTPTGVVAVWSPTETAFADHDVDFLESVGTILTTGIERQEYERRLNETVDELEASNERLEQFAYAASHDLQEPLRMISSYLQLVERRYADQLDEDGEEFIAYAVDGAERLQAMIDGLLEYSRIDTQGDPFEPVDLEAVLADVRTDLQVLIEQHDATVRVESLPTVSGDPRQLRQLFQNLLSNAIQYSGDEPPRIEVWADRTGSGWEISVQDDGIGIDPDEIHRVFQVFQRLHSREEYDGTGIGLALCQRIAERHDGDVHIDSEPGVGTTVTVTLPAAE
ncbi:PAS domain-containing sensor histidine kinase [Halopiger goleimassiliensis]|uniref:PAS domain-containing sensor histidine kinase n=1 Tax=Halopiger goleimassiliensis TaxID=1293048 RepID=UPI00067763E3|nr:PAS domain S-box protein [Halopiger goleimassiliensis]